MASKKQADISRFIKRKPHSKDLDSQEVNAILFSSQEATVTASTSGQIRISTTENQAKNSNTQNGNESLSTQELNLSFTQDVTESVETANEPPEVEVIENGSDDEEDDLNIPSRKRKRPLIDDSSDENADLSEVDESPAEASDGNASESQINDNDNNFDAMVTTETVGESLGKS